jgi:DUF1680 family protein
MEVRNNFSHRDIERERAGWFECSCCPTNICRFIPAVPGYIYAQKENDLFVNLFVNSSSTLTVNNKALELIQENNYPWDGALAFTVRTSRPNTFNLRIRVPGWAMNSVVPSNLYRFESSTTSKPVIKVNGGQVHYEIVNGYAVIGRSWKNNDRLTMELPMDVRRVECIDSVKNNIGKVALQRGPLIYCAEWDCDHR